MLCRAKRDDSLREIKLFINHCTVSARGDTGIFLKCFKKVGITGVAELFLYLGYSISFPKQVLCRGNFLQGDIVTN